ncbi:cytochrome P450 [Mycolicibacterium holsaticum]|uniref:cytochrome P450 n=1 Tax=Mycolicibacterium holsaticum TaxID=152142 RepID=UPI001C7D5114|nr:cytochrome P450 [Mycolicibacterium holsaticum]MDA4108101.1 cytochrome P450 [Mycolicibacterium holsaticum DSM 44478 = JCM 12374]QZA14484.1 cytochrome P450 [Mycolicibacterium holsaticum DSM 44478 = JCM 12374]UNC08068.1 cytochrome P450 [Mycolicibacterium holsaticum DSM 44478 = JCM 12374]
MTEDAISIAGVDLTDPDIYLAGMPYDAFRELRRHAPVAWHPYKDDGFYAVTGYDEILAVSRDSATWSSQAAGVFFDVPVPEAQYQLSLMMLTMDPPRHTKLRSLVSKGFTPRQVARLNDHVAGMAREIVDAVVERVECDFVYDIAGALPSFVIAELLGIPLDDGRRLYELTEIMNSGAVGDLHDQTHVLDAQMQMFQYGTELAARKRAEPGDDIATSLLRAEVDGESLTDLEFNMFFLLLINAGGDTTRNLVAAGILALLEHPGEQARLATDPDRLDIGRAPNPHLAFGGGGTHFCLGANLARVEAAAIIPEVLSRMKDLELAGPVQRVRSTLMNGIRSMPVRFTPSRRLAI